MTQSIFSAREQKYNTLENVQDLIYVLTQTPLAKQENDIRAKGFKVRDNFINRCNKTSNMGLNYVPLDLQSLRIS